MISQDDLHKAVIEVAGQHGLAPAMPIETYPGVYAFAFERIPVPAGYIPIVATPDEMEQATNAPALAQAVVARSVAGAKLAGR